MFRKISIVMVLVSVCLMSGLAFGDGTITNGLTLPDLTVFQQSSLVNGNAYLYGSLGVMPGSVDNVNVWYSPYYNWDGTKSVLDPTRAWVSIGIGGVKNLSPVREDYMSQSMNVNHNGLSLGENASINSFCSVYLGGGKGGIEKGSIEELLATVAPPVCPSFWSTGNGSVDLKHVLSIDQSSQNYHEFNDDGGKGIIAGAFAPLTDFYGNYSWRVQFDNPLTAGQLIAVESVNVSGGAPVPEPASIGLLGISGIALLRRRR
ncbi:PEP-CTERM sorting domain-containing protein [Candidatus Parcubacteria bacterium]|nr:PEP-CTERM sorting domain-containing protein [Candidatus Parcubacteria bacterium]